MSEQVKSTFTYLGHATVRCDLPGGKVVLIDPWVEQNPACPEAQKEFERIDALLVTHGHFDHMSDAVSLAKKYNPSIVVANFEICHWLESQGVENCSAMNLGGAQEVLGTRVTMVRADHSSGILDGDRIVDGGVAAGFVVRLDTGYTFYHAGDTALFSDMQLIAECHRPQLAFLPIGDHFTMGPEDAARACKLLGVRKVIPIHWGTFPVLRGTPEEFAEILDDIGCACSVIKLEPGETYG